MSYTYMNKDHLNLDSHLQCGKIPLENVQDVKTSSEKKDWRSQTIKSCPNSTPEPTFQDIYARDLLFTTDQLLSMVEEFNRSYHGKLHVDG